MEIFKFFCEGPPRLVGFCSQADGKPLIDSGKCKSNWVYEEGAHTIVNPNDENARKEPMKSIIHGIQSDGYMIYEFPVPYM